MLPGSFARHAFIVTPSVKVYSLLLDKNKQTNNSIFFPPNKVSLEMDPLLNPESAWHILGDIWRKFFIIRLH